MIPNRSMCAGPAAAALALLLLGALPSLAAQEEKPYPHGDFEEDCTMCHETESWTPAKPSSELDHGKWGFPLAGAHAQAECRACHATLRFSEAEPDCVACHLDVHVGELGTDCSRCHSTRSFIDRTVMVRRHVATRFPLRGTHLSADCADCHPPVAEGRLRYVNTPTECEACHLNAYLATTNPAHQTEGFPTQCEFCHVPTVWEQARFNHALVTGSCQSCHLDDYQATTNPDHEVLGFPTTCETCHRSTAWRPTTSGYDHDRFPIYSGTHRGRWTVCSDCHTTPTNYADFTCLTCHPHSDRDKTNGDHQGIANYAYDSLRCYECHPRGNS